MATKLIKSNLKHDFISDRPESYAQNSQQTEKHPFVNTIACH